MFLRLLFLLILNIVFISTHAFPLAIPGVSKVTLDQMQRHAQAEREDNEILKYLESFTNTFTEKKIKELLIYANGGFNEDIRLKAEKKLEEYKKQKKIIERFMELALQIDDDEEILELLKTENGKQSIKYLITLFFACSEEVLLLNKLLILGKVYISCKNFLDDKKRRGKNKDKAQIAIDVIKIFGRCNFLDIVHGVVINAKSNKVKIFALNILRDEKNIEIFKENKKMFSECNLEEEHMAVMLSEIMVSLDDREIKIIILNKIKEFSKADHNISSDVIAYLNVLFVVTSDKEIACLGLDILNNVKNRLSLDFFTLAIVLFFTLFCLKFSL